ncbi:MAG TPA: S8 family serine peptidase [Pyrinomonadaceae bacterium]|nr:S8 family serine peptidase [Pyrinomonadaceae bacterium]
MPSKISSYRLILILSIIVGLGFALSRNASTSASSTSGSMTSVIVEFRDDPAAVYKARSEKSGVTVSNEGLQSYRDGLRAKQDEFLKALAANGVQAAVKSRDIKNYDGSSAAKIELRYTLVFNGMTLSVPDSAIPAIAAMPQVKKVHPNGMLYTMLNQSVNYIHAPQVYGKAAELSQFDDLREGYEGQGMYISIIDTGVDWTHPMFGGDPTPPRLGVAPASAAVPTNKKVVYYLPLTDIGIEDGFGHGTHVASTAAGYLALAPGADGVPGTTDDVRLHGVAPQAKIMSYKVCSDIKSTVSQVQPIGGCEQSDTIMAIEDSVSPVTLTGQSKPVALVINMSLGGAGGPDTSTAVASSNAALLGTTVVAASGNSGPGEGTTGAPAAGTHVISVGASTHPGALNSAWSVDVLQASAIPQSTTGAVSPAKNFPAASGFNRLKIFPMAGTPNPPAGSLAQRYVLINNPTLTWPASVSGRIALVKKVTAPTFAYVSNMAAQSGAVGVIFMSATENATAVKGTIPSATISLADGEILVDAISSTDDNNVDPSGDVVSQFPIRMNPIFSDQFMGEMAGFSSRGPVRGLGQIKPDVSAPGVQVLAAVPPASLLGALSAAASPTSPNYGYLDGTSMASPHTAGAAVLIKQAHLDWSPDVIRTVLINTATNMRNESSTPKSDGPTTADSIIAQGGGLIDVKEAVNAKALMGVEGDGIDKPAILGSHSYGEVPVVNNRVTNTIPVNVTVRDLSGEGGTYNLNVANNRDLQIAGINVSLSQSSVTLQPNGTATFVINASLDGDKIRDVMAAKTNGSNVVFEMIQMQWYVTAKRSDNAESLRMPFYFKPGQSLPAQTTTETITQTGTVPVGDQGLGLASGVTYIDVPFEVSSSVIKLEATTEWFARPTGSQEDIDYELLDPDGNVIANSGGPAGASEFVSVNITRPGTYTHHIIGFQNAATDFTVKTTFTKGTPPPALQAIAGDFMNAQGKAVDFDGNLTLSWQGAGGETGYEVERSSDGTNYETITSVGADQQSVALADQPNGQLSYRVRALVPGQLGKYVTAPSSVAQIIVDRRGKVDITNQIATAISNVSFAGGVFNLDLNIKNNSTQTYVPLVELSVVRITSTSGTVSVKNADNAGNGKSAETAALFGYSNLLGADQEFAAGEITGNRTLQFNDAAAELFSFDVSVTAFERGANGSQSSATGGGTTSAGGSQAGSGTSVQSLTKVMRITVNPLTKAVSAKLL